MGGGSWDHSSFSSYTARTKKVSLDTSGYVSYDASTSARDIYTSRSLNSDLNPYKVIRECCETSEHPDTIPVILALDVTGSMGQAAVEVSKSLGVIMKNLYTKFKDIEFLIMGIGDLECDSAPIQASQFESDIRIAQSLDKLYFEFGGGGNYYESYSAAWFFGLYQTKLDCWERGKKGIIITLGDETLNPKLYTSRIKDVTGQSVQGEKILTPDLYEMAKKRYDIYHIDVVHGNSSILHPDNVDTFAKVIGEDNVRQATIDQIPDIIVTFISASVDGNKSEESINWNKPEAEETVEEEPKASILSNEITW